MGQNGSSWILFQQDPDQISHCVKPFGAFLYFASAATLPAYSKESHQDQNYTATLLALCLKPIYLYIVQSYCRGLGATQDGVSVIVVFMGIA